jgi:ribonuclease HI
MAADDIPGQVRVYTDGACQGNPGPGGWGWAVEDGPSCSGAEAASTNQRMEVWAAFDALTTFINESNANLTIVSDSTYVVNCFNKKWYVGWKAKGWKNAQKQSVANQDLWKPFIDLYLDHAYRVSFEWVKGHSGDKMNDTVDALAVEAAAKQIARRLRDPGEWFVRPAKVAQLGEGPDQQALL